MKSIFLAYLIILLYGQIQAQQSKLEIISALIDSVYSDKHCCSESEYKKLFLADSILLSIINSSDTSLTNKISQYIEDRSNYINFESLSEVPMYDSEKEFYNHSVDYIGMQKYIFLSDSIKIDSILKDDFLFLLDYIPICQDTQFLGELFRNSNNTDQLSYAYDKLYSILDSVKFTQFYFLNNIHFIKDKAIFDKLLIDFKEKQKPITLLPKADSIYLVLNDTTEFWNNKYYFYIFNNGIDPREIDRDSSRYFYNLNVMQEYEEQDRMRLIEQEEYYRINDSINIATIYDRFEPYWKNAYSDTTLWEGNGSVPVLEADDGMRFDTFPTEYLLSIIDTISFHNVYDTMQDGLDLNQCVMIIHLRKIFQILGDRCAYGLFVPDTSQRIILNQWIDDYYLMACNDTIYYKRYEACHQMLRMWRLLFPKLKNWIGIESKCANGMICVLQQLSNMVTESMVLDIIADGDVALAYGDTARVETLGYFLARVWRDLEIPENQRIQRRPVRTAIETQQWVDAYIYPALVRWNHPTSWK
ncbi:MAG: hypothetical protein ABI851_08090 [Saprospiraceae bacterium]